MKVPFLDLKAQYDALAGEIDESIRQVIERTAFSGGPFVSAFEEQFASFCQCKHSIGVGSGTEALWLALVALDIGQGDEVITVPNSFIATAEAISFCGATPIFVDVDEQSQTMNPALLEGAITEKTKAIIPVHLFGQMADMAPIMDIARRHNLFVIEDACQAHGALYNGRPAGSIGDLGCFSFYPGKNLGAYGEAGGVVTNSDVLSDKIKMIRDHGQSKKYHHAMIGWNGRMDGIQGAILSVKLKYLAGWNESRRKNAQLYTRLLSEIKEVSPPREMGYAQHIFHVYAIKVQDRDALMTSLTEQGISCGIHYPVPIHLQNAYQYMGVGKGSFPVAEKCAEEIVSLPMFPELTEEQIQFVVDGIKKHYSVVSH
jgi:dTDP-4-amino-4,6-dideoxygalactose transaminase